MLWVLRRARDRGPGHYSELATATARWRPRSSVGMAWQGEEGSSARESGSRRSLGCRMGRWEKQEVACGPPRRRAALLSAGTQRSREGERRKKEAGLVSKFWKVQGSHCKTKITSKLGLK